LCSEAMNSAILNAALVQTDHRSSEPEQFGSVCTEVIHLAGSRTVQGPDGYAS
jgi:hypothetical protein